MKENKIFKVVDWVASIISAIIMLQTLFFKFTGAEESIYIFTKLGIEPVGRIGSGIVELIASILILIPRFRAIGALLGLGTMSGAILSHLTVLGIVVMNDGGQLFIYGLIVMVCCTIVLLLHKNELLNFINKYILKKA